jgi:hypothetical protein
MTMWANRKPISFELIEVKAGSGAWRQRQERWASEEFEEKLPSAVDDGFLLQAGNSGHTMAKKLDHGTRLGASGAGSVCRPVSGTAISGSGALEPAGGTGGEEVE